MVALFGLIGEIQPSETPPQFSIKYSWSGLTLKAYWRGLLWVNHVILPYFRDVRSSPHCVKNSDHKIFALGRTPRRCRLWLRSLPSCKCNVLTKRARCRHSASEFETVARITINLDSCLFLFVFIQYEPIHSRCSGINGYAIAVIRAGTPIIERAVVFKDDPTSAAIK